MNYEDVKRMENKARFERGDFAERSTVIKGVQPGDILIGKFANFLIEFEDVEMKVEEVRDWFKKNGVIIKADRGWVPTDFYLDNGYMRYADREVGPNGFKRNITPYITPEGVEYFTKRIKER